MNKFIVCSIIFATILLVGCNDAIIRTSYKPPSYSTIVSKKIDISQIKKVSWRQVPGWQSDSMIGAVHALHQNCLRLGLKIEWYKTCMVVNELSELDANSVRALLEANFMPYEFTNNEGPYGLVTGYYEPSLHGSHVRSDKYKYPLYRWPFFYHTNTLLPSRANLKCDGILNGNELVWIDDQINAFFLQVQGSGQVLFEDGSVMYISFDGTNNQPYHSIGKWLIDHGEVKPSQATMQGIKAWAHANPARIDMLLNINPRFVFFKEIRTEKRKSHCNTDGPIGAFGVHLTPKRSIAVDPLFIPLGTAVFLQTTYPETTTPMNRLVFAQDIGSEIKGRLRVDYFWGFGEDAANQAGKMKQVSRMWLLLPKDNTDG
ncbi:MAG: MltA domain-containing protein [Burkholderia sp.]|nr:MltA domain-containing protein [Burkholderia sp.]